MIGGTVCSGIGAPEVASVGLPIEWAWTSEIDPFASAVLAHRFPGVPNRGDFTQIKSGAIDLLVGGTPCQSFSVAGLRGGMADDRGNLALEFLRLSGRLRPRWVVWENVPGVLSSGAGRDFGSFLGGLAKLGYGFAYRVLDAQHFGVPQRRRRVFVVGHSGDWRRAAAVLFERNSLSGNPPPRREAGASVTQSLTGGAHSSSCGNPYDNRAQGGFLTVFGGNNTSGPIDVATACNAHGGTHGRLDFESETFVTHSLRADGFDASEDGTGRGTPLVACTLPASNGGVSSGYHPVIPVDMRNATRDADKINRQGCGVGQIDDPSPTLSSVHVPAVAFGWYKSAHQTMKIDETCDALQASPTSNPAVAFQSSQSGFREVATHATLDDNNGSRRHNGVVQSSAVRRLTPRECERLQGFPDDFTLVPYRGNPAKDGPRYKAIGNSMAVPVMRWIVARLLAVDGRDSTGRG